MSLQIRKNYKFFFHKYSTERQDGTFERTGALKSLGTVTLKKKTNNNFILKINKRVRLNRKLKNSTSINSTKVCWV